MGRARKSKDGTYTVRLKDELCPFIDRRAHELRMSASDYLANLIMSDQVNVGKPLTVYPIAWVLNAKAAELPERPPILKKQGGTA